MKTEDRFRMLDRVEVPDQWGEIERRQPSYQTYEPPIRSRLVTLGVALAVAVGGIAILIPAFFGSTDEEGSTSRTVPGSEQAPSIEPPAKPPADRLVLASGEVAGEGWELFTYDFGGGPVLGHVFESNGWGWSEASDQVDPCSIESDAIHWIYLRQDSNAVVVMQFHVLPREAVAVRFVLDDGRQVPADIIRVPDSRASWDVFVVVFDGPPGIDVEEVVIDGKDGSRLDDPSVCGMHG